MTHGFVDCKKQTTYTFCVHMAWLLGITAGIFPFFFSESPPFPVARRCFICPAGLGVILFISLIPVVLTAVFSYFAGFSGLALLALLQGFLFSYVSFLILISLGTQCMLVSFLLLFTHILCLPVLYFLWLQIAHARKSLPVKHAVSALVFCLLAGLLDYALVMPFTASLINI